MRPAAPGREAQWYRLCSFRFGFSITSPHLRGGGGYVVGLGGRAHAHARRSLPGADGAAHARVGARTVDAAAAALNDAVLIGQRSLETRIRNLDYTRGRDYVCRLCACACVCVCKAIYIRCFFSVYITRMCGGLIVASICVPRTRHLVGRSVGRGWPAF